MTALSIGTMIGFAPTASAATPVCNGQMRVAVGSYNVWAPTNEAPWLTLTTNCVMRQGMAGMDRGAISALQYALRVCNGANGLANDGQFGPLTTQAVRDFQARVGISADGVYGPQTRRAMYWPAIENGRCQKIA
ncbi:peptidoglycan-binding protein [Streptomyces sp. NPDC059851]|uniref:peptidoglycan-binding domain-containing protein n=1 Tax=Streptomyces sp. NPDC059851 TaxID=3346971 RepID=UPI00365CC789